MTQQLARPFYKHHLVSEAAFEQNTHSVVPGRVGQRYQDLVLRNAKVGEAIHLCQGEETAPFFGINLRQLAAKILRKNFVEPAPGVHWFLADDPETLLQRFLNLIGDEGHCIHGFFDVGILCNFRDFLVDLVRAFRALAEVTKHPGEQFLLIFY
jgi:hypothetical protein